MTIQIPAEADFGQTDFGHPYLTDFGQSDFHQNCFFSLLAQPQTRFFSKEKNNKNKQGAPKGAPRRVRPRTVGPRRVRPRRVRAGRVGSPKISRFFSLSCHHFALFVSLWVSSSGMLMVFLKAGPLKCARLGYRAVV